MSKKALPHALITSSKGFLAIGTLACALALPVANAVSLGHARIVQGTGHAFDVQIPITNLSAADDEILAAQVAPPEQWQANGLKPPVDLNSLRVYVQKGSHDNSVLRVVSEQAYTDSIVDLLLYVKTASGFEPFQVSIVAPNPAPINSSTTSTSTTNATVSASAQSSSQSITVKPGDTMFAIAKHNAVQGVSIYQLMIALQNTNPKAFIKNNINLVRAGANLKVPSLATMLAISDAEARRLFVAQTRALSGNAAVANNITIDTRLAQGNQGTVSYADEVTQPPISGANTDIVRLSDSDQADKAVAEKHALQDAKVRVSQLEHNVRNLNEALRSQGRAASDAVTESAKALNESLNQLADSILGDDKLDTAGVKATANADGLVAENESGSGTVLNGTDSSANNSTTNAVDSSAATQSSGTSANSATGSDNTTTADTSRPGINLPLGSDTAVASEAANTATIGANASANIASDNSAISSESSWLSWFKNHLFGVITSILALIVILLVWLLRSFGGNNKEPLVTKEMVDSKLGEINLDLNPDEPSKQ